jgi:hypothetical protein
MEIIKAVSDLGLSLVFVVIALGPRVVVTLTSLRANANK